MVKATKEDIIIGFILYCRINPQHPHTSDNMPDICYNTNEFVDGAKCENLIYSTAFKSSMDVNLNQPVLSKFKDIWNEICTNYDEHEQIALISLKTKISELKDFVNNHSNDDLRVFSESKARMLTRINTYCTQANIII